MIYSIRFGVDLAAHKKTVASERVKCMSNPIGSCDAKNCQTHKYFDFIKKKIKTNENEDIFSALHHRHGSIVSRERKLRTS